MRNTITRTFAALALIGASIPSPAVAVSCMNPSLVPAVSVSKTEVCWSEVPGASGYDVVLGLSLGDLGFAAPTLADATLACLGTAEPFTCVSVPYDPPAGDGFFFTVRPNRGNSAGSYETGCPAESPGRDDALGIAVSCP